mmetsp:Transcript_27121/g.57229  ORF Transcript_27121/g.57229 Transcript_27121/m.57229 type:complete len:304 (-) Transcript_27121:374-1285(-)
MKLHVRHEAIRNGENSAEDTVASRSGVRCVLDKHHTAAELSRVDLGDREGPRVALEVLESSARSGEARIPVHPVAQAAIFRGNARVEAPDRVAGNNVGLEPRRVGRRGVGVVVDAVITRGEWKLRVTRGGPAILNNRDVPGRLASAGRIASALSAVVETRRASVHPADSLVPVVAIRGGLEVRIERPGARRARQLKDLGRDGGHHTHLRSVGRVAIEGAQVELGAVVSQKLLVPDLKLGDLHVVVVRATRIGHRQPRELDGRDVVLLREAKHVLRHGGRASTNGLCGGLEGVGLGAGVRRAVV